MKENLKKFKMSNWSKNKAHKIHKIIFNINFSKKY